ncbi:MAG: sugar phosphate nucleotidyltransferase, partial [Chloroflexota bacterium]
MEQAVILAAGEGQRLRPLTRLRPKVMLKVAGKPILQY